MSECNYFNKATGKCDSDNKELPTMTEQEIFGHNSKCVTISTPCDTCAEKDKRIEELQAEIARVKESWDKTAWENTSLIQKKCELEEENERLKKLFDLYGSHTEACGSPDLPCGCGYEEAVNE